MDAELQQIVINKWIDNTDTGRDELCILMLFAPDSCPGVLTTWAQEQNGVV